MSGATPPPGRDHGWGDGNAHERRYVVFDALRCLAAAVVLYGHALNLFVASPGHGAPLWIKLAHFPAAFGQQAVIAFFVLSGFWISKGVAERQAQGCWNWSAYAIDRLSRLWMVLIPALLVGGTLDLLSLNLARFPYSALGPTILGGDFAQRLTPVAFFGNLLFLQKLLVPLFGSNTALWSLANEFWYYLWFPVLVGLALRRVSLAPTLAAAASLVAFPSLLPGFACWLCGALLYAAQVRWCPPRWAAWPAIVLGTVVLIAIRWRTNGADLPVAGVVALVLWCSADTDVRVIRPLAAFGRQASYSLYVCHIPVLTLAAGLLLSGSRLPICGWSLLATVGLCAVVIAYAWIFSRLTEAHTATVRRWIRAVSRATVRSPAPS